MRLIILAFYLFQINILNIKINNSLRISNMYYNNKSFPASFNKGIYLNQFANKKKIEKKQINNYVKYYNQQNIPIPLYNNSKSIPPEPPKKKTHNLKAITSNSVSQRNNIWGYSRNNLNFFFPEINNNILYGPNIKPLTAYELKRPEEKLRKGQNQLILERLQEKFSNQVSNNKKLANTGLGFYQNGNIENKSKSCRAGYNKTISAGGKRRQKSKEYIDLGKRKKEIENAKNEEINNPLFKENSIHDIKCIPKVDRENSNFIRTIAKDFGIKRIMYPKKESKINKSFNEFDIKDDNNNNKNILKHQRSPYENIFVPQTSKNGDFTKNETIHKKIKKCQSGNQLQTVYSLSLSSDFSFTKIHQKQSNKYGNTKAKNEDDTYKNQKENFSSKTSSNFFQQESKPSININNLINRVIENNKKAAAAKRKDFFSEIGKDFMNNHMRRTSTNFYSSNSSNRYTSNKGENSNTYINPKQPQTLNSLEITLLSPVDWRKHEEIWMNISSLKMAPSDLEKHLIPPNDNDVLVSAYCKMNPYILNFCSFSNISTSSNSNKSNYLSFIIDDNMKNPKLEMKKWKEAYKKVILRWHPDKLLNVLKEVKFKDDNKISQLRKKSTVIINNMNVLYKKILEILRKILQKKNYSESEN